MDVWARQKWRLCCQLTSARFLHEMLRMQRLWLDLCCHYNFCHSKMKNFKRMTSTLVILVTVKDTSTTANLLKNVLRESFSPSECQALQEETDIQTGRVWKQSKGMGFLFLSSLSQQNSHLSCVVLSESERRTWNPWMIFALRHFSVMWGEAITLQNSSYPPQSINIHHPVTTHSSPSGKKRAEEGKVCVIPLIKSRESSTKVTFSSKIICSWQISVGRCYYSHMNSLALGKKFIFSEMGECKSLWSYSVTTKWFK